MWGCYLKHAKGPRFKQTENRQKTYGQTRECRRGQPNTALCRCLLLVVLPQGRYQVGPGDEQRLVQARVQCVACRALSPGHNEWSVCRPYGLLPCERRGFGSVSRSRLSNLWDKYVTPTSRYRSFQTHLTTLHTPPNTQHSTYLLRSCSPLIWRSTLLMSHLWAFPAARSLGRTSLKRIDREVMSPGICAISSGQQADAANGC